MLYFAIGCMYIGFFGAIGFACHVTQSAWPLLAIILMPTASSKSEKEDRNDQ